MRKDQGGGVSKGGDEGWTLVKNQKSLKPNVVTYFFHTSRMVLV